LDAAWLESNIQSDEFKQFVNETYLSLSGSQGDKHQRSNEVEVSDGGLSSVEEEVSDEEVEVSDEEEQEFKGKGKARVKNLRVKAGRGDQAGTKGNAKGTKEEGKGRSQRKPKSKEFVDDDDSNVGNYWKDGETAKLPEVKKVKKFGETVEGEVEEMVVDEASGGELKPGQVEGETGGRSGSEGTQTAKPNKVSREVKPGEGVIKGKDGTEGQEQDEAPKRKRGTSIGSVALKRPKTQLEPLPSRSTFKLPFRPTIASRKQGFALSQKKKGF
jgi:hypothetical protein